MDKKTTLVGLVLTALLATGFLLWRVQENRAESAKVEAAILPGLTAEEISMILKSQNGAFENAAATAESKALFLHGLREHLALAAQARRDGLDKDPSFQSNFGYKTRLLLADLYAERKGTGGVRLNPSEDELAAVWSDPASEAGFSADIGALRSIQLEMARQRGQPESAVTPLAGGALEKARKNWARAKVLSDRAQVDADFMASPELPLRIKVLEAGILSADYLRKNWTDKIKSTERERSDYLASHPEFDSNRKIQLAKSVLEKARSGSDFAKLAAEFSEDRTSKDKGGLYENVASDTVWQEVEAAVLGLEAGNIAPKLIESNTGFHIVKLEKKEAGAGSALKFTFRHILFQHHFPDPSHSNPGIPAPFISAAEITANAVEKGKRDRLVADIIARNPISLPDDFN